VWPRNEAKEGHPTKHEGPCAADNRVGGGRDWLVPRSLAETPPRLFLAPACFKGTLKPYAENVVISVFRCLLFLKTNCLEHKGFTRFTNAVSADHITPPHPCNNRISAAAKLSLSPSSTKISPACNSKLASGWRGRILRRRMLRTSI
jgi:hypothetical protein